MMTGTEAKSTVRIFISSPGDVSEERERARQVIESLRRRYAPRFLLKPVLWEDLALQADVSFQQGIDLILSKDQGIDIAVFILWSRLGSAVGPLVLRDEGGEYRSGTERELDLMLKARDQSGGVRPSILAYVRNDETCFEERLRGKPTSEKEDLIAQKKLVETFIAERFRDQVGGYNTRAFHAFDRPAKFAQRLRTHLIELLDGIAGESTETLWDVDKQGPPYLGLESFQPQHADIFFGREQETQEVRLALQEQAKAGCAFLLLTGASGSGKSSLARSGVLPDIVQNELDDQVVGWRSLIVTPAELAPNPIRALLRRLAADDVWPDLPSDEASLDLLARGLTENPGLAFGLGLQRAINDLAARSQGGVRLLLVLDQLEEVFATHVMTAQDRASFLQVIETFARSGAVWVLATARSDFYHQIQTEPSLVRLLEGRGPMSVLPPDPDALQRLIEEPARLAGLKFEERDGVSLARQIFREAQPHAEVLPLLEFVLQELYEKRDPTNHLLTYAAYDELGGIEAAIGKQAEALFRSLPEGSQAVLDEILPLLVTVEVSGEQSAVRRRASLDALRSTPERTELTDSLIRRRFLATDRQDRESVASFTHEALLRRWERIARWIRLNHEHLRIRSRVLAAMNNWQKYNRRNDLLLSAGKPLDEALELSQSNIALEPSVLEFIALSGARARRNQWIRRLAIASLVVLTILSITASVLAWDALRRARQKDYDNSIAIAERELSLNQDIGLADTLLNNCDEKLRGWEWHYLRRLRDGARNPIKAHDRALWGAEFSPDGKTFATVSIDGRLRVWDSSTGSLVKNIDADKETLPAGVSVSMFSSQRIPITCLAYSPDGRHIATGSFAPPAKINPTPKDLRESRALIRVWDWQAGTYESFDDAEQLGVALSVTYSPDGAKLASSSIDPENTFLVRDLRTRKTRVVRGHTSQVHRLRYSPDSRLLASAETSGVVKLWDAATLKNRLTFSAHPAPVVGLSFDTDGGRLATAGEDGSVRVWDVRASLTSGTARKVLTLNGHMGSALDVRYSPDGRRIASAGFDKTVRVWDALTGDPKLTLRGHDDTVWSVAFDKDGEKIVSASFDKTVRIWDAAPRRAEEQAKEFTVSSSPREDHRVNSVAYSPDGRLAAFGGWDNDVHLVDGETGAPVADFKGHKLVVWGVAFSPDGDSLASASWDHTVRIWDRKTGKALHTLTGPKGHTAPVHAVAFSPDGKRVVSGGFDGQVKVWDVATGQVVTECDGFVFPVLSVAFSPDGRHVASGGSDRLIRIWDAARGTPVLVLRGHEAAVHSLSFDPDGKRIASAGWDKTVRIWNADPRSEVDSAQRMLLCKSLPDRVHGVVFSRDGRFVASACEDKLARVLDASSGKDLMQHHHRGVVWSVTWSPDGERLAVGCWDSSSWVRAWRVQPRKSP